jgi:hypothetical protein
VITSAPPDTWRGDKLARGSGWPGAMAMRGGYAERVSEYAAFASHACWGGGALTGSVPIRARSVGCKACNKPSLAATSRIVFRARTPARLVGEEGEGAGMGAGSPPCSAGRRIGRPRCVRLGREQSVEEGALALERDAKVFGGDVVPAVPLGFQRLALLGE